MSRSSWSRGILLAPQATGGKPDLRAPARAGLGIGVSLFSFFFFSFLPLSALIFPTFSLLYIARCSHAPTSPLAPHVLIDQLLLDRRIKRFRRRVVVAYAGVPDRRDKPSRKRSRYLPEVYWTPVMVHHQLAYAYSPRGASALSTPRAPARAHVVITPTRHLIRAHVDKLARYANQNSRYSNIATHSFRSARELLHQITSRRLPCFLHSPRHARCTHCTRPAPARTRPRGDVPSSCNPTRSARCPLYAFPDATSPRASSAPSISPTAASPS